MTSIVIENPIVIPSTGGTPSKYTPRYVFANKRYFVQSNRLASNVTMVLPVNNKNNVIPMASELLRKIVEIINAKVVSMIMSIDEMKYSPIKWVTIDCSITLPFV